ncbi:MAG: PIN domain-containing protein [Deltaproteobacteria bacterium]|nr:PIN domain-containing protein [Deltaproteobacteria bacterium]
MNSAFLETSMLLNVVFHEAGCEQNAKELKAAERLVASRLLRVEAERALLRLGAKKPEALVPIAEFRNELDRFLASISFFEITRDICDLAARLAPNAELRTLDAIHLATFLKAKQFEPRLKILSCDKRILGALQEKES